MGKKRDRDSLMKEDAEQKKGKDDESSDDEEDFDIVNVDFEWFNFDADVDFHGTKTLLRQLLDVDAPLVKLSGLAEVILGQPTIGSTVKVGGKANDAYAMLTALNLAAHRENDAVAGLATYLSGKAANLSGDDGGGGGAKKNGKNAGTSSSSSGGSSAMIKEVLDAAARGERQVGLVLGERLINMPSEIAPPMYTCLLDELEAAVEDGEPYDFSHVLVLSKVYREVESTLGEGERRAKKPRDEDDVFFYFHPEDEVLARHAVAKGTFAYSNEDGANADSKRAFQEAGIKCHGSLMLIEGSKFAQAVAAVVEYLKAAGQ